jgi:lipopolysaccharide/colanic/teichoic acid biosynthesis glycosyltransferase
VLATAPNPHSLLRGRPSLAGLVRIALDPVLIVGPFVAITCDLRSLRNWSLGLDFAIILKTVLLVVRGDRRAY